MSLEELDARLDVGVAEFELTVARLIDEFRARAVCVRIPRGHDLITTASADSSVPWPRLYQAQIQRLPRRGRAEEFVMARRYEFFKARAAAALREMSYPEDCLADLLKNGSAQLPPPPITPSVDQRENLESAIRELEELRSLYIEGALYMVSGSANRYRNLGVDFIDLIQEGNSSLFQAVDGFDWRRGVRFKTYAQYWVQQAILKALYNCSRTVRVPTWVQKALSKIRKIRERRRAADGAPPSDRAVGEELGMPPERVRELLNTKRYATSLDAEIVGEDGASLGQLLADERSLSVVEMVEDGDLGECLDLVMSGLPSREHMILTRRFGLRGQEPETLGEIGDDLGITAERVRQLQNAALVRLQRPAVKNRLDAYG